MMPALRLQAVTVALPASFENMQVEARAEGYRFLDRLAADWKAGTVKFDRDREALVAAWHNGTLAGIGGITLDLAIPGVLRMRRFYVRAAFRRGSIGRALTHALLGYARQSDKPVIVNAKTTVAPAFWEALGFAPDPDDTGHTHRFPAAVWPELTEVPPGTHSQTKQERTAWRKTPTPWFPHTFSFRQGLSRKYSARFWLFKRMIDVCRESCVSRYAIDRQLEFPYAYQKAVPLVPAGLTT